MLRFLPLVGLLLRTCYASSAVSVPWNTSHAFGPDGPWYGVSIVVQNPQTSQSKTVSMYPSTRFGYSWIPTAPACSADASDACGSGGELTWSYTGDPVGFTRNRVAGNWSYLYRGDVTNVSMSFGNQVIFPAPVAAFDASNITYPSGKELGAEVGVFYLGDPGAVPCGGCNPSLRLYNTGVIPSYTHGMTMGSAALEYPGSLVFGGYDAGRVIGPILVAEQQTSTLTYVHQLLDVVIGVETGESPLPDNAVTSGLLRMGAQHVVTQPLAVTIDGQAPYIFLPSDTTKALVSLGLLPVYLDSQSKYYLWNTSSPLYTNVVSSASYLGFVFSVTSDSASNNNKNAANITIKVPFTLLNLTLESSVSGLGSDLAYFPIQPMDATDASGAWVFGRAFLQAAFWGKNWNQNVSWLAQAPGPGASRQGLGYSPQDIAPSQTSLSAQSGADLFNQSWAGHWTPLPLTNAATNGTTTPTVSPTPPPHGISGGAIAGIVIGVLALFALFALGAFFFLRRKSKTTQRAHELPDSPPASVPPYTDGPAAEKRPIQPRGELDDGAYEMDRRKPEELKPVERNPAELFVQPSELAAHQEPQELPTNRWSGYGGQGGGLSR